MNLRERFPELVASIENHSDTTFDDISFEDLVDQAVGTLEEYSAALDTIALAMEQYDGVEDMTVEDFEPELQALLMSPSLEDHGLEIGLEAKVGGVSNFLGRFWQVYFLDFLTTYDWIVDLIKDQEQYASKYTKRIAELRHSFKNKKRSLDHDHHVGSYVMLHNYWFTEDGFVKNIFEQLKVEDKISQYVLFQYPKAVDQEIAKFISVVKSAKFTDVASYEKTVVNPLGHFKHPVKLFDKALLGGRPYLMNTGFALSRKSKDASRNYMDQLAHPNKVTVTKWLTGFQMRGGVVPQIIPDVSLTTKEIDDLLNWGDHFIDMSRKLFHNVDSMKHRAGELRGALERTGESAKDSDNPETVKELRQLGRIAKNLIDCYWSPSLKMAQRNLVMAKGIAYLGGRMVAAAK